MDLFKFNNSVDPTKMEQGEIINDLKRKLWIERYEKDGEFELVANASTGMRERLPIGSFISHVDTPEIMIVENHEINDDRGKETEITITGRGFETFFEERIVGSNKAFPSTNPVVDFNLPADYSWNQAVALIEEFILASKLLDDDNALSYISVLTNVIGSGVSAERIAKRGTLYSALLELLKVDDLGIKIIRPGPWSPLVAGSPNVAVVIHKGVDRSNEVIFSYDTGEIESADYLWSIKKLKNAAMIHGKWVETIVTTAPTGVNRRWMLIDASDIDGSYAAAPTGFDLSNVVVAMQQRGTEVLASQNEVALTKAEVSKDTNRSGYRTDFDVGDIITVSGDYTATMSKRISEYVEIEDENGKQGYPTLTEIA